MKENTTYTTLLDKYLDGMTSTHEEEALLRMLREKDESSLPASERAILLMLDGAATARLSISDDKAPQKQNSSKISRSKVWWITMGSVAAAAMLTLLVKMPIGTEDTLPVSPLGYQAGKAIESEDEAVLLAEELLAEVVYDPVDEIEW
ncbi:hypothetical protein [Porphyromonas sp.]|uniref:hypothetical protein n=1 Tax=Porphyromonas sp. TaxID=1924944 RepID=UPI0026DA8230|nr:hypothetical protein [Porphyromonas sp.]MDO4770604.1 hypothetical protein [Porphyromonas sp.]